MLKNVGLGHRHREDLFEVDRLRPLQTLQPGAVGLHQGGGQVWSKKSMHESMKKSTQIYYAYNIQYMLDTIYMHIQIYECTNTHTMVCKCRRPTRFTPAMKPRQAGTPYYVAPEAWISMCGRRWSKSSHFRWANMAMDRSPFVDDVPITHDDFILFSIVKLQYQYHESIQMVFFSVVAGAGRSLQRAERRLEHWRHHVPITSAGWKLVQSEKNEGSLFCYHSFICNCLIMYFYLCMKSNVNLRVSCHPAPWMIHDTSPSRFLSARYILLSGSPPFSGNDTVAVLDAVRHAELSFEQKAPAQLPER